MIEFQKPRLLQPKLQDFLSTMQHHSHNTEKKVLKNILKMEALGDLSDQDTRGRPETQPKEASHRTAGRGDGEHWEGGA